MPLSCRSLLLPLLAAVLSVAGCASSQLPQQAYEGPARAAAEVAVLEVPEDVQVMAIDGREPPASFLRSQVTLALLPGEHVLSLRYVHLFQINADDHEVIRSGQAALRFVAAAGAHYRLEVPPQRNVDAARQFAKAPQFRLVDLGGGAPVESVAIKSYAEASLIDTLGKAFQSSGGGGAAEVTNMDLLKDIWSRSSRQEQDAFRAWINQQTNQNP